MTTQARTAGMPDKLDALLDGWHHLGRETALAFAQKHGPPDEVGPLRLAWNARGPWKTTIVYGEAVEHRWPTPHHDVIEQVIDYHVPLEKAADLLAFHGGLGIRRTRGELAICCGSEDANACALNFAHDLVESRVALHEARAGYARRWARDADPLDPYVRGLLFGRQVATRDPDEPQEGWPDRTPRRSKPDLRPHHR